MKFARERVAGWRRSVVCGIALAAVAGSLTACSPEPPGPESATAALAAALTSGDFSEVPFAGGEADVAAATAARTAAYEGLAPWEPAVKVVSTTVEGEEKDTAEVTLGYTWDVNASDADWTYETHARFARDEEDLWHATWSPSLLAPDLVDGEILTVQRLRAERANVLGAGGAVIVEPRTVHRLGIDKTQVAAPEQDAAARTLAGMLGIDPDTYAGSVTAAGEKAFVEAITIRDGDPAYDVRALAALPGVHDVVDTLPLAPSRRFARPILGSVGVATAEIIEKSDGAVVAGDLTGLSGLQRQYDAQLRGLPGLTVTASQPDGVAPRQLFSVDPTPGTPLTTTLDVRLQDAAESVLSTVTPASAVVAIRPSTGEVLAAASGTGGEGMSTATLGQFAPGSTFKVVSALALLRSGLTADSDTTCPATVSVDGRSFTNFPEYPTDKLGTVPLRTAFAYSCNTAFISARDTADQKALIAAAGSLGLDPKATLGFPGFLGDVPGDSDGTDHAASMIGQGRVLASPLGMATVAASVARGATVVPRLVLPAEETATPAPAPAVPLTAAEGATLHELMRGVVAEGGATFLQDVPGEEVAAKTGTAQFGPADNLQNHVWMVAIQGDLAVAVFVDVGEYGSTTAGPLLEQFLVAAQG
ncbi:penicillin-binding transpeptidase domain-containing protein [Cellulomonas fengjieae]|uniref:Beta-lactamase n=1 Tax=Cellulomonas fengjieae TaxID=2819978 RepID=A0ABS3SK03_9CELL|nr:penicillin-binding transpeptidase domain-containing protein [Cellulomonas fengjieae]MBO3086077.1 penicillin-binding protein [Cellulomonas fengjieae]QVI65856.1 penicillin-binding protein [Cellulomonas fengjieae]